MEINKTSFIAGAGSALLLGAAFLPGLVGAQSSGDTPTVTPTATATEDAEHSDGDCHVFEFRGEGRRGLPFFGGLFFGAFDGEALATALDVPVEELRAAFEAARESLGDVVRAESEEEFEALRTELLTAVADELGITVDELERALEAAKAARHEALIERVESLVEEGKITQERADAIIEELESGELHADFWPGSGRGRGPGARFEFHFNEVVPSEDSDTTPSSLPAA